MPEKRTIARARRDRRAGKAPSTQAGEFVREEVRHVRQGKHGARSAKQAIAIGLSKARRAGVQMPMPKKGKVSDRTRRSAMSAMKRAKMGAAKPSAVRSAAALKALKREGHRSVSKAALARQARAASRRRGTESMRAAARKAVRTKGHGGLRMASRKAARTRVRHRSMRAVRR